MDAYEDQKPSRQPQLKLTPYPQPYPEPSDPTAPSRGYAAARWILVVALAVETLTMARLLAFVATSERLLPEMALAATAPLAISVASIAVSAVLLAKAKRPTSRLLLASSVASAVAWLSAYFAYGVGDDAFAPAGDMTGLGDALMYVFLLVPAFYTLIPASIATCVMYDTRTPRQVQENPSPKASKIACAAVIAAVVATYAISHISTIHANETELQGNYESNVAEAKEVLEETGLDARGFEPLDLSWDEDDEEMRQVFYYPHIERLTRDDGSHVTVVSYIKGMTDMYDTNTTWDITVTEDGDVYARLIDGNNDRILIVCEGDAACPDVARGLPEWGYDRAVIVLGQPVTKDALDMIATMGDRELRKFYDGRLQDGIEAPDGEATETDGDEAGDEATDNNDSTTNDADDNDRNGE